MSVRDLLVVGALAGLVIGPTAASAADKAPLPAGGPAAQSEAGPPVGTVVEIGGLLFVATAAGLMLIGNSTHHTTTTSTTTTK
jgi:hypothetical protein